MRLALYSDLHLEFAPFAPPALDADVIVLAGDIAPKLHGLRFATELSARCPVVYVLGNHEYYGTHTQLVAKLKASAPSGVYVLENDAVVLRGVRFIGCTLWTDFTLTGEPDMARSSAERQMNDYRRIRSAEFGYKRLNARHTYRKHVESRSFLEQALSESFAGPTAVITHHAPSGESLSVEHRATPIAAAYASDLRALVASSGAALWVHGHTHHNVDYRLGATRVLTNQRGYADEPCEGFDPGRIVEL